MNNKIREIKASSNDESCPADTLMYDFRKKVSEYPTYKYEKNIDISKNCIEYWKDHADIVLDEFDIITFMWYEILEENLPPLKIKVKKNGNKYNLMYLKEYGEDKLIIQGKNSKGKNKNGRIYLDKEIKKGRSI